MVISPFSAWTSASTFSMRIKGRMMCVSSPKRRLLATPIALTTLFYLSPVFYPAVMVPAAAQGVYFLNPIAGLLTLYHDVLYWGRMPSLHLLGGMLLAAVTIYLAGYALFRRYAAIFPEIV